MKTKCEKTSGNRIKPPLRRVLAPCLVAWMTACLLHSGLLPSLRADTVISAPAPRDQQKDPPSRPVPLCLGQAIVRVDFSKANFDKDLAELKYTNKDGKKENEPCLLIGMINGRLVAADALKNKCTNNRLFFVDLLDSKNALFSGLYEDCITVVPSKEGKQLSNYINDTVAYSSDPLFNRRGQLLHWILPSTEPQKPEDVRQLVLMTDGYQKGGVDLWSLEPELDNKGKPIPCQKLQMTYKGRKLLGNYKDTKGSDLYVTALDCIDLNQFKASDNKTDYPKALIVWCKPEGCTGHDNLQLTAPKYVFSCMLEDDNPNNSIPVKNVNTLPFVGYTRPGDRDNTWQNIAGGSVVAPDKHGDLAYWFAKSEGKIDGNYFRCDLISLEFPIFWDAKAREVRLDSQLMAGSRFYRLHETTDSGLRHTMTREYNVEFPGPGFEFDSTKTVYLTTKAVPWCDEFLGGDTEIGSSDTLSDQQTQELNRSVTIKGGKVLLNDLPARLTRVKRCQGVQVKRVILGWPYVAMLAKDDPSTKGPSIEIKKSNTQIEENGFNNGLSCSFSASVHAGIEDVVGGSAGIKAGYEYKYDHTKDHSFTIAEEADYEALKNDPDPKRAYAMGCVFVGKISPQFLRLSRVLPLIHQPYITVRGDSGHFFCPAVGMSLAPEEGDHMTMVSFLNSDPANVGRLSTYQDREDGQSTDLPRFQTDYAPMSDGLMKKPYGSLIQYINDNDLVKKMDDIRAWQSENPIADDLIRFSRLKDSGVTPYGRTEGNNPGCYVSNFNNGHTLSITTGSSDIVTRTHEGFVGLCYSVSAGTPLGGFKAKSECLYKGGSSTKHSKSEQNTFTLHQPPACDATYQRWYYFFNIDVPSLKSYMLSHEYDLVCNSEPLDPKDPNKRKPKTFKNQAVRPTFIPKYCWDLNQSFVLGFPWIPDQRVNVTKF
ncbi:MAG: hypothetical protein WCS31_06060 [Verrucomicrobiae bacterium]